MNKWISISVAIILTAGLVVNGVLYVQANGKLEDAQSQISTLEEDYETLGGDFTLLSNNFSSLEEDFSGIEDNLSSVESDVSSLEDDVSAMEDDVSAMEDDVSTLEDDVSSLEGDVSTIEGSLYTLTGNISNLENGVSTLEDDVSSLADDVSSFQDDISALEAYDRAVIDAIGIIEPSVVRVIADLGDGWYSGGSGVIFTNTGWVLTNLHVIDGAESVTIITMDGEAFDVAEDFYVHDTRDIAIIKIDSSRTDFPAATLGSSSDLVVGEEVITVGYPYSYYIGGDVTFTTGIVSSIRTTDYYTGYQTEYIQIDAPTNPGNSGGPLINLKGEVVGINTWKVYLATVDGERIFAENLNFAIPIDDIKSFPEEVTG